MSGLDEQFTELTKCPNCNEHPDYYTLGADRGTTPLLWFNSAKYSSFRESGLVEFATVKGYKPEFPKQEKCLTDYLCRHFGNTQFPVSEYNRDLINFKPQFPYIVVHFYLKRVS